MHFWTKVTSASEWLIRLANKIATDSNKDLPEVSRNVGFGAEDVVMADGLVTMVTVGEETPLVTSESWPPVTLIEGVTLAGNEKKKCQAKRRCIQ